MTLGEQQDDGMSQIRGWLTPETRATFDAVLAKLGAPGMCNPNDDIPHVDGAPSEEAIERDTRSPAQRNHDALNAALRALLTPGEPATQRVTRLDHRYHHAKRAGFGSRTRPHRRRHHTAHE